MGALKKLVVLNCECLQSVRIKALSTQTAGILLTYCIVQPSWEANWVATSQEFPHISQNPKVHYRTHKRQPPVPILGQPNPVRIPTYHLLEIHPNIIHPSTPRSPQWSPFLRFPQQDPIHSLSSPIRATCPAHFILTSSIYQIKIVFLRNYETIGPAASTLSLKTSQRSAKTLKLELKLTTLDSVFQHTVFTTHIHICL